MTLMLDDSLDLLPLPENWRDSALCREVGADLFFADHGGGDATRSAKRVCGMCPVVDQCREEALANGEPYGVWGGLTERERRDILRKRRFVW